MGERPWEEEWRLDDEGIRLPDDRGFPVTVRGPWTTREQERLASAAPDLARALLAVEWKGYDECDGAQCPSCYAPEYVPPARYDVDGEYLGYTEGKHTPDCALDAALRKAGAR